MATNPIPEGFHSITPYLSIEGAAAALDFYQRAFGAQELFRLDAPGGVIGHAELQIGNSRLMLSEPCGDSPMPAPKQLGGSSVGLYLYVEDVDSLFAQAVAAGASIVTPVEDQFYGDRTGTLRDPFGHIWFLATHQQALSPEELRTRAEALYGGESGTTD